MHGALLEALNAAAAPTKAELAASALPAGKNGAPQQAGSPALANALLPFAAALLKAAGLSLKRSAAVAERLPLVAAAAGEAADAADAPAAQAALQAAVAGAAAAVEAGKRQAAETAGALALASDDEAVASLAAAQAAYSAYQALLQAASVEALVAATSLRLQEGAPAAAPAAAAASAAAAAAQQASANGGAAVEGGSKKDKKKKEKGAPQGMLLGKGTALLRAYVENAAAGGPAGAATSGEDGLEAALGALRLGGADVDVGASLAAGLPAVLAALDPQGHELALHLGALRAVIEANQVSEGAGGGQLGRGVG